jgi:2-oxoglutarate dehydrogenase E1 component
MKAAFQAHLSQEFEAGKSFRPNKADWLDGRWSGLPPDGGIRAAAKPAVPLERLREVGAALTRLPESFNVNKTVRPPARSQEAGDRDRRGHRLGDRRGAGLRHAAARGPSGAPVGPGLQRGTFSHRHSVLVDQQTEETLPSAQPHRATAGELRGVNSMLSE